LDIVLG